MCKNPYRISSIEMRFPLHKSVGLLIKCGHLVNLKMILFTVWLGSMQTLNVLGVSLISSFKHHAGCYIIFAFKMDGGGGIASKTIKIVKIFLQNFFPLARWWWVPGCRYRIRNGFEGDNQGLHKEKLSLPLDGWINAGWDCL